MASKYPQLNDREWLEHEYIVSEKTDAQIARELGCSTVTVCIARQRHDIPSNAKAASPYLSDKEWLENEYVVLEKSEAQIARELGCAGATVGTARRRHGIPKTIHDMSGENSPAWRGGEVEYKCEQCGETFRRKPSTVVGKKHIFCRRKCLGAWKSEHLVGENSPVWRGGATEKRGKWEQNGGRQWRRICRKRDNYTCQLCGKVFDKRSKGLQVHHMASFADNVELRSVVGNGICLCERCHIGYIHSNEGELLRYRWEQEILAELGVAMVA